MWEGMLIAGIVIIGLGVWLATRNGRGRSSSRDGDGGTTFFAGYGDHSQSSVGDCADTGNDSSGCDSGGGGDGGGGSD
jgi:hypothetical protein